MGLCARRALWLVAVCGLLTVSAGVASAAGAGTAVWYVRSVAQPGQFSASDPVPGACELFKQQPSLPACNRYQLVVLNVGSEASSGPVTVTDTLPVGITAIGYETGGYTGSVGVGGGEGSWGCAIAEGGGSVTCSYNGEPIPAGVNAPWLFIMVAPPAASVSGTVRNEVSVTGGGAPLAASTRENTPIGTGDLPFELNEFTFDPEMADGSPATLAGGHPWTMTVGVGLPTHDGIENSETAFTPAENGKNVIAELPIGFSGDPQAVVQCAPPQFLNRECPAASIVGSWALSSNGVEGTFISSGEGPGEGPMFSVVPSPGYPAEFAVTALGSVPIYLYASVVHGPSGYHIRVTAPGLPVKLQFDALSFTFFGVPGQMNGTGSTAAFLSNPADCSAGPLSSRLSLESWETPGHLVSREATAYQQITGCDQLHFEPSLTFAPSAGGEGTTQADEPSGFTADLKIPQTTDSSELATPPLKTATVTLPAGASVSPAAAQGLAGCQATGEEGINIGSSQIGPAGEDLGDPMATELGEGHGGPGGNSSPYDDGLYHVAPGHCPDASRIGDVEAVTPILPNGPNESAPLHGHIYLAAPQCGGAGQSACTEASAANGELFGIYLELAGDGVIVKVAGMVAANPSTGQLTATFRESPQFSVGELKLHFDGGPTAPMANPQTCVQATTSALLEPWSAPETASVTSTSSFDVDWDGQGGACPATMPFAPSFSAGTVSPSAGAFSPFTLTFSRQDREQDLAGLTLNTPPGLLGLISQIPLCGEPQAAQGTCPAASRIGSATVASGAGPQPLWLSGQVYLTGPYKGRPFGLSIVTPADAGPFHLGNVVVRSSIAVDPNTAALTVASDPLPQIIDGVPLRLRTVNVTVDRPGFMFNPTNCSQQQITGTLTAAQGASAAVSSPFTASGCKTLPFKPSFSASTQGNGTSGGHGASLDVKIAAPGQGPQSNPSIQPEANISKVDVSLPLALSSRLTTLNKACTEAQFAANPAGCPAASNVGTAVAHTPVLPVPLEGPAYLVSHGGAAFPDLVIVLQGDGVTVNLTGNTQIKKGITYSRFETTPDAPISSFELNLPEGQFSILGAITNLCKPTTKVTVKKKGKTISKQVPEALIMPTSITGQNGAVLTQNTKISVTECKKTVRHTHKKAHRHKKKKKKK